MEQQEIPDMEQPHVDLNSQIRQMTGFEHHQLRGITIKNAVVTIISTASIVASVATTYFQLKQDIGEVRNEQINSGKITELRLNIMAGQISVLQTEVDQLKKDVQSDHDQQLTGRQSLR